MDLGIALLGTITFVLFEEEPLAAGGCCIFAAVLLPIGFLRWRTQNKSAGGIPLGQKIFIASSLLALAVAWIYSILLSAGIIQYLISPPTFLF